MATFEEIRHRIEEADTARSARRSAAATQIGELAQRRANIVEQLEDIERQLGEVLATASDVIDIAELSRFTDVPTADLIRWLDARTSQKASRSKRKRPVADTPVTKKTTSANASLVRRPAPSQAATAGASTRAAAQTT